MDFFSTLLEEKDKKIQVLLSQAEAFNVKIRIMLSFPFKNVFFELTSAFWSMLNRSKKSSTTRGLKISVRISFTPTKTSKVTKKDKQNT